MSVYHLQIHEYPIRLLTVPGSSRIKIEFEDGAKYFFVPESQVFLKDGVESIPNLDTAILNTLIDKLLFIDAKRRGLI